MKESMSTKLMRVYQFVLTWTFAMFGATIALLVVIPLKSVWCGMLAMVEMVAEEWK